MKFLNLLSSKSQSTGRKSKTSPSSLSATTKHQRKQSITYLSNNKPKFYPTEIFPPSPLSSRKASIPVLHQQSTGHAYFDGGPRRDIVLHRQHRPSLERECLPQHSFNYHSHGAAVGHNIPLVQHSSQFVGVPSLANSNANFKNHQRHQASYQSNMSSLNRNPSHFHDNRRVMSNAGVGASADALYFGVLPADQSQHGIRYGTVPLVKRHDRHRRKKVGDFEFTIRIWFEVIRSGSKWS